MQAANDLARGLVGDARDAVSRSVSLALEEYRTDMREMIRVVSSLTGELRVIKSDLDEMKSMIGRRSDRPVGVADVRQAYQPNETPRASTRSRPGHENDHTPVAQSARRLDLSPTSRVSGSQGIDSYDIDDDGGDGDDDNVSSNEAYQPMDSHFIPIRYGGDTTPSSSVGLSLSGLAIGASGRTSSRRSEGSVSATSKRSFARDENYVTILVAEIATRTSL